MSDCCVKTVPQSDSSYETFARPVADWQARLTAGLNQSIQAWDQTLGHLEEQILHQTRDLERRLLAEAAQKKADQSPPGCPVCGHSLSRRTRDHPRTFHSRFGPVTIQRLARLVSALPAVALSGRSCTGFERDGWRLAIGAGNGGAYGQ